MECNSAVPRRVKDFIEISDYTSLEAKYSDPDPGIEKLRKELDDLPYSRKKASPPAN